MATRKRPVKRRSGREYFVCAALVALTLVTFAGSLRNGFINYDDPGYVTDNRQVLAGLSWSTAAWALTATQSANWHPLTWISHLADVSFFGLDPAGHHAVSLGLHAANAAMLFLLLRWLTGALWPSALAAALFAVHPLRVESVAWVAERKDVLSAFFWIATMAAYRRYLAVPTPARYVVVVIAFALGLAAKPMLVTLPLALLLLDYWPLGRLRAGTVRRQFLEKTPLLALSTASCIVTYVAQAKGGAVASGAGLSITGRFANAILAYTSYLRQTFWPRGLSVFYPLSTETGRGREVALAMLLLIAISGFALWRLRRTPAVAVGWCWYLGTLVPVIGLVQVGLQARADRYTYIPSIGLSFAVAWGLWAAAGRGRAGKAWLAAGSCAVLLALSLATRAQVEFWQDSTTLFRHALAVAPESVPANNNLGLALAEQGDVAGAIRHFRKSLAIEPTHAQARYNLGTALDLLGSTAEAVSQYRLAVNAKTDFAQAHNNLAVDLAISGRLDEAIDHFRAAGRIAPELPGLGANLSRAISERDAAASRGR